jgi:hypothetical protein
MLGFGCIFKMFLMVLVVLKAVFMFGCFRSFVIVLVFLWEYVNSAQFFLGLSVLTFLFWWSSSFVV